MIERFYPNMIVDSIEQIDLEMLKKKGIKGLILDIDNTLVPSFIKEADERTLKWIDKIKRNGFKACILSNARKKRVEQFNEKLGLKAIYRASKPGRRAFTKALDVLGIDASQAAVVGDQIFTDVYGGNRLGMYTILVKPIHKQEFFFVKLKRYLEKYVLRRYYSDSK
ncbi:MAG TPA: YqeG family HAD IIIA-type phosphatase [Clostridiaceae bacterium]|nr:YqeG family HAD IIIA-type phosphatase [Clostridiaceae bacterium]